MKARIAILMVMSIGSIAVLADTLVSAQTASSSQSAGGQASAKVTVEQDGTVKIPSEAVPVSKFLSPEGKAYLIQHLHDMQDPSMTYAEKGDSTIHGSLP